MTRTLLTVLLSLAIVVAIPDTGVAAAKKKERKKKGAEQTEAPQPAKKEDSGALKPYTEIISKDAVSSFGLFDVHLVKDKYYFEIPDSLLGRDILLVNRIHKAPADYNKQKVGYPGDMLGEEVLRFERGPQNKMFLRSISYLEQATDTAGLYTAVQNSNVQAIVGAFDVKTHRTDTLGAVVSYVFEVTDYIKGDKGVFGFTNRNKKNMGLASLTAEASYIDTVKVFPGNVEVRSVKTYARVQDTGPGAMYAPETPLTYELNTSLVLLPDVPMKPRLFDPRVAYFAVRYTDFDSNPQGVERRSKITRWRLEPREEDVEKYLRGELVEPKKPIVIYIDPATPKKWVPYLIAGVNDWQPAFEQAGFKNAIIGLEAPDDPSWSLEDARHSAIVYKPSDIPNASGPHVHDPRSGEILETHINWYHNVMYLLRNWYTVQVGAVDPRARKVVFDDELMGELIRFVSSHEVGHTLGLRHNFGSSATVPVEKLRDKAWVEANGHTPSIMDYARFNYVAQPEDGIGDAGIFPRVGIYDKWSVEWGYRWLPQFATAEEEIPFNNRSVMAKLAEDRRYQFGTETDRNDPRNQNEDLGDDAMLASEYGIRNLKRIVPEILDWYTRPDRDYSDALGLYNNVTAQFGRYMGHVTTNVAGIYSTPRMVEENAATREFVPAATQKRAVEFLNQQLFATPIWLSDKELIDKAGADPVASVSRIQRNILGRLISRNTIDKMTLDETYNGKSAYTALNMFADLKKGIWSELTTGRVPDIYRRNLQQIYVDALIDMSGIDTSSGGIVITIITGSGQQERPSDAPMIARAQLAELNRDLKRAAQSATGMTRYHYQNLSAVIDATLDGK